MAEVTEEKAVDTATGEQTAEETQQTQETTPPEFDPSKVDLSNPDHMELLTDEQIEQVEKYNKEHPAPVPGTEEETPGKDTAEEAAAAAAEKAKADATKYAGKYATTDDLVKGVSEIAEKLGLPKDAFQLVLDSAKEAGEFKSVEGLYKKLEKQLSEKGAAPAQEAKPGATPGKDTVASPDTFNPQDPQVKQSVDQLTVSQIASSSLAQRMQAKGLALPKDMPEFDALAELNPYFAMEFKQLYQELYKANLEQAKGWFDAEKTLTTANASVVDADSKAIKALADEQGFKVTDEEIAAVKTAALANPASYETRYDHKFLRANAVRDQFLVSVLPTKIKEIALAKQSEGRAQAAADLERAGKREVRSLGTAKLGSRTRAIQKMPDLTDPDVLAALPDAALNDPEGYFRKQGFVK